MRQLEAFLFFLRQQQSMVRCRHRIRLVVPIRFRFFTKGTGPTFFSSSSARFAIRFLRISAAASMADDEFRITNTFLKSGFPATASAANGANRPAWIIASMASRLGGIELNALTECLALMMTSRAALCSGVMFSNTLFSFHLLSLRYAQHRDQPRAEVSGVERLVSARHGRELIRPSPRANSYARRRRKRLNLLFDRFTKIIRLSLFVRRHSIPLLTFCDALRGRCDNSR